MKVVWEYKKPYMIYSHDHRDVVGEETARLPFARTWFNNAFLSVFISPMHRDNFHKALGDIVKPYWVLTPPVDTDFFYPRKVTRELKSAVSLSGRLVTSKGLNNVYKWAIANPTYTLSVYTKFESGTSGKLLAGRPNIKLYGLVPYEMLPEIYSKHQYVIHLPTALEAAGRTLVEGALCGCTVIANEQVGVMSFSEDELKLDDQESLQRTIREGPYKFWYAVTKYFQRTKPCWRDVLY